MDAKVHEIGRVEDGLGARSTLSFVEEERAGLDEKKHSLQVVISTGKIARDGHSLRPDGVDLKQYKKNPIVLYAHDYGALPIGTSEYVKPIPAEGRVVARPTFHMQTELSREVWALVKEGVLRAWSVGFIPQRARQLTADELKAAGIDMKVSEGEEDFRAWGQHYEILTWELLEFSSVPVPADAGAITEAVRTMHDGGRSVPQLEGMLRAAGFEIPELVPQEVKSNTSLIPIPTDGNIELLPGARIEGVAPEGEKPEETAGREYVAHVEEYEIVVTVRDMSMFKPGTINCSPVARYEQGIYVQVGQVAEDPEPRRDTLQSFHFYDSHGWTVPTAVEWVEKYAPVYEQYLADMQKACDPAVDRSLERVEETEDFIHVPVRDKGDFISDTFRTIDISEDEGISAVAGKLTDDGRDGPMTVQKYLFAKEKGWTVAKATKWVADHEKAIEGWLRTIQAAGLDPAMFRFEPPNYAPTYAGRRGAIPYKDLGAADEGEAWDAGAEVKAADVDDLKLMAAWVDSDNPDAKGSYKFPHHKQDGKAAVWRGVANAMGRLGRSAIPAADKGGVYAHLAKHYAAWDKEPPERARALESVSERVGKVISKATAAKLERAAAQIEAAAGLLRELATPAEVEPEEKAAAKAAPKPRRMSAEELRRLAADAVR